MQLKDKGCSDAKASPSIRDSLVIATSTLLVGSAAPVCAEEKEGTLSRIDLSAIYYSEDERVSVNTTHVAVENELGDEEFVRLNIIYDTITGASPNGRIVQGGGSGGSIPFTSASGFSLSLSSGDSEERKWMTEFTDKRAAIDLSLEKPLTRTLKYIVEGNFSSEDDYISYGVAGTLMKDFNQRNTTVTAGLSVQDDSVEPASGTPLELAIANCSDTAPALPAWANCNITAPRFGNGSKKVFDGVFGVTQVLNERTVTQLNYSLGSSLGYLTDPYKLISVVDHSLDGEEVLILYEKRPDRRTRQSLYWKTVSQLSADRIADFSYRYFWDDWGIKSHTIDFKYRIEHSSRSYTQPHLRINLQSEADFFYPALDAANSELPRYASADYRLGELKTYTVGLKYGRALGKNGKFAVRAEYIKQNYADIMLPDMEALVYQGTFTFNF